MKIASILALTVAAGVANADLITEWNFNGTSSTTVPGGTISPTPSTGAGIAALIGGTTATFASGTANGGSSDPITTTPSNYAWNTTTYPAQGANPGTAGIRFDVDTTLFQDIIVEFDTRHSNTSSRYLGFDYSIDGGSTWTSFATFDSDQGGDKWYNNRVVDLSAIAAVENTTQFAFRIVTIFAPGGTGYVATTGTSTYATGGTLRYDMVQISGTKIPAPGSLALLGLGGLVAIRRRR
jgi:hypothetical protein